MKSLVVVLLLLLAAPAAAELTALQKTQLVTIHQALRDVEDAQLYLGDVMLQTLPANRTALKNLATLTVNANKRGLLAIAYLGHANPFDGDAQVVQEARPVSQWVSAAWPHVDAMIGGLQSAQQQAANAAAVMNPDLTPAYYDGLRRIKDQFLAGAILKLGKVDRTLGYLEPLPANFPRIIGPHGEWANTVSVGYTAQKFLSEAQDRIPTMYGTDDGQPFPHQKPWQRFFLRSVAVSRLMREPWLNAMLIPLNAKQCAMNPFHLVQAAFGPSLSHTSESGGQVGGPYHFDQLYVDVLTEMQTWASTRPLFRAQWTGFLSRWSTAWRFMNGSDWRKLTFPDDATLQQLREQGFPSAQPFAPPLCGS